MTDVLGPATDRVLQSFTPPSDEILTAMASHAADIDYPVVGPDVGRLLSVLTRAGHVRRAFEFGSGFGYSAYWIARALPSDGEVVLTDVDGSHLDRARDWFDEAELLERAVFEPGDAHETIGRFEEPFDLILLDHYNRFYVDAFAAATDHLASGGLIVADNALSGNSVHLDDIAAAVDGRPVETNENTAGTVEFLDHIMSNPAFETALLPVGDGLSVSVALE